MHALREGVARPGTSTQAGMQVLTSATSIMQADAGSSGGGAGLGGAAAQRYAYRAAVAAAEAEAAEGLRLWTVACLCRSLSLDNILTYLAGARGLSCSAGWSLPEDAERKQPQYCCCQATSHVTHAQVSARCWLPLACSLHTWH
jgi:hypothetical protein